MRPEDQPQPDDALREIIFRSDLHAAKGPEQEVLGCVCRAGYSKEDQFAIQLALEEALTNAIRHGNGGDPTKHVTIRYAVSSEKIIIRIADEGPGFQPTQVPDPTTDDRLECPSGRGVMLMHAYMTKVTYNDRGNEVTLIKVND